MSERSFRVSSHIRPLLQREREAGCLVGLSSLPDSSSIQANGLNFTLDSVHSSRDNLFQDEVQPLIESFVRGYHGCLLASGQTSSGKSYTMGFTHEHGVNDGGMSWLTFQHLESKLSEISQHRETKLTASFIEVYQDKIRDLLSAPQRHRGSHLSPISASSSRRNSSSLQLPSLLSPNSATKRDHVTNKWVLAENSISVRDPDPKAEVKLVGAEEVKVSSAEEMRASQLVIASSITSSHKPTPQACLLDGLSTRATASTLSNDTSSRSHAIFILRLYQGPCCEEGGGEMEALQSTLYLCDLAGSERINRSGASGLRLTEACSINGGLLALSNVIMALSDPQRNHIPYRDHILTRLLRCALGGNSKTLYLACLSPSDVDVPESLNTLSYASRCRMIKQTAQINKVKEAPHSSALIALLRSEIEELRSLLQSRESSKSNAAGEGRDRELLEADLNTTQQELEAERSRVIELEAANSALKLKLSQSENEQTHLRQQLVSVLVLAEEHIAEGNENEDEAEEDGGGEMRGSSQFGASGLDERLLRLCADAVNSSNRSTPLKNFVMAAGEQESVGELTPLVLRRSMGGLTSLPSPPPPRRTMTDLKEKPSFQRGLVSLRKKESSNMFIANTFLEEPLLTNIADGVAAANRQKLKRLLRRRKEEAGEARARLSLIHLEGNDEGQHAWRSLLRATEDVEYQALIEEEVAAREELSHQLMCEEASDSAQDGGKRAELIAARLSQHSLRIQELSSTLNHLRRDRDLSEIVPLEGEHGLDVFKLAVSLRRELAACERDLVKSQEENLAEKVIRTLYEKEVERLGLRLAETEEDVKSYELQITELSVVAAQRSADRLEAVRSLVQSKLRQAELEEKIREASDANEDLLSSHEELAQAIRSRPKSWIERIIRH